MPATTSNAMRHLEFLAGTLGPRQAATPAHHQAEFFIRGVFEAVGLQVDDITLDFPEWELHDAALTHSEVSLPLDVNPFSPSCAVSAPLVAVSTMPELEAADLRGKIAVLYG